MVFYCEFVCDLLEGYVYWQYYDYYYGFLLIDDNELFGMLILEINQAGLFWEFILKKVDNFRVVYVNFDINMVVGFIDEDWERLFQDVGIICNKFKVNVVIYNVQ